MSKGAAYGFIPAEQMEQLVRRQQANLADPPTPAVSVEGAGWTEDRSICRCGASAHRRRVGCRVHQALDDCPGGGLIAYLQEKDSIEHRYQIAQGCHQAAQCG